MDIKNKKFPTIKDQLTEKQEKQGEWTRKRMPVEPLVSGAYFLLPGNSSYKVKVTDVLWIRLLLLLLFGTFHRLQYMRRF